MEFRINYEKIISQANSISDNADKLSAQALRLEVLEQDIRSAWKGQAADSFLLKISALRDEMNRTKQQIAQLATTIKGSAERIKRADEAAQQQAASLNQ